MGRNTIHGRTIAAIATLLAAACSGPSAPGDAAPVDPAAGRYAITLSGSTAVKTRESGETYCLKLHERADFPHLIAMNYYLLHSSCTVTRRERTGNSVGGEIACAADPKMAEGWNRFIYDGSVGGDRVDLEVAMSFDATVNPGVMSKGDEMRMKLAMKALERMRLEIVAVRVGDC